MGEEIKDSDIAVVMDDYAKMGFDEEKLDLIRKDLEYGIDVDVVNAYTTLNGEIRRQKLMSKLARKGLDAELAGKFSKLEPEVMKTIGKLLDKGVTIDELHELISDCHRPYQIQEAIKQFVNRMSEKKRVDSPIVETPPVEKQQAEVVETEPSVNEQATNGNQVEEIQEGMVETAEVGLDVDRLVHDENQSVNVQRHQVETAAKIMNDSSELMKTNPVISEQVRTISETEVSTPESRDEPISLSQSDIESIAEEIERKTKAKTTHQEWELHRLNDNLNEMMAQIRELNGLLQEESYRRIKERRDREFARAHELLDNAEKKIEERLQRDQAKAEIKQQLVKEPPESETDQPNHQTYHEPEQKSGVYQSEQARGIEETRAKAQSALSNIRSIPGYQAMLRFADGTIVPVDVDRPSGTDKKAFASLVGRMFGKKSPQNALVRQLINRKLTSSQLHQIKKAVQYRFPDRDLKDLIESDLPAEEMAGIIDVVMADRGAVTEGGGA